MFFYYLGTKEESICTHLNSSELSEYIFIFSLKILSMSLAFCRNVLPALMYFIYYDILSANNSDFVQLFLFSECINIYKPLIKIADLTIFCVLFPSS